jgi:hypothetical protein
MGFSNRLRILSGTSSLVRAKIPPLGCTSRLWDALVHTLVYSSPRR